MLQTIDEFWHESLCRLKTKMAHAKEIPKILRKYASACKVIMFKNIFLDILMKILVLLIIAFVIFFIYIGIVWFYGQLGVSQITEDFKYPIPFTQLDFSFHQALNYHIIEADLLLMIEIVALILLGILLIGVLKEDKGITILPFDININDETLSGKAIAEMLIFELNRIRAIHRNYGDIELVGNLRSIKPNWFVKSEITFPDFPIKEENLSENMDAIGTFSLGTTSLPLGNILMLIRQLCPFTDPGSVVTGCVQKYGPDVCLVARMKWKNCSWLVHLDQLSSEKISYETLSNLIREISYNIFFEQLQSKSISSVVGKNNYGIYDLSKNNSNYTNSAHLDAFKNFTEAVDCLNNYNSSKDEKYIELAKNYAKQSVAADRHHEAPLYLLFNIGIIYINKKNYYEAERLARYLIGFRPDSPFVWYSWGLALRMMHYDIEAIECYDVALELRESSEKDAVKTKIKVMKALSLRRLKEYKEALILLKDAIDLNYCDGFVWGHYGLTLEFKYGPAKKEEVKLAYKNAIKYFPQFVSVYSALARLYRKDGDIDRASKICKDARKYSQAITDLSEYNRACFWINCGNERKARKALEIAVTKKAITYQLLNTDPDWGNVRDKNKEKWFMDLLDELLRNHDHEEINNLISKYAIRSKFDEMDRKKPLYFYNYELKDIKEPRRLVDKLNSNDKLFIYLKSKFEKDAQKRLDSLERINDICSMQKKALVSDINILLKTKFYSSESFKEFEFSDELKMRAMEFENLSDDSLCEFNRDLLCEIFQIEIKGCLTRYEIRKRIEEIGDLYMGPFVSTNPLISARIHSVFGHPEEAIKELRCFVSESYSRIKAEEIRLEPDFEYIRDDDRFGEIMRRYFNNN